MQNELKTIITLLETIVSALPKEDKKTIKQDNHLAKLDALYIDNRLLEYREFYTSDELQSLYKELNITKVLLNKALVKRGYIETGYKKKNKRLVLNLNYNPASCRF
jgi:hypothetical protein